MTMAGYDILYLLTLATVAFGAMAFTVLTLFYWREWKRRRHSVFAVFTLVCAAAFGTNLLLRIAPRWEASLTVVLDIATGLLPALLVALALRQRKRLLRTALLVVSFAASLAFALDDLDFIALPLRDLLPGLFLGAAALVGLLLADVEPPPLRRWYRVLFAFSIAAVAAAAANVSALAGLASDYLLLAIFCVTLYYQERLVFFDILIKRGAFFGLGWASLLIICRLARLPDPVTGSLILLPLLLLTPWADAKLVRWIDRVWLRRRFDHAEAARLFTNELQLATTEKELQSRVARTLEEIFQGPAVVSFQPESVSAGPAGAMTASLLGQGWIRLQPRASGIPYMSGDQRLLDWFAHTLAVVLENVRLREERLHQQEREQHLRLLASRAELKALRAQINPHFLFNALNAIAGLIPIKPALADQTVEQLAQVFRYTLRKSHNEWVRLLEEVEFCKAYLRVEQARFGDRLRSSVTLDPAAAEIQIPAMCIQPLIENAVKHGASLAENGGLVALDAAMEDGALVIEVCNNGPAFPDGFRPSDSAGHGLRNVAERLTGYFGQEAGLGWRFENGLTRVRLRIPCRQAVPLAEEVIHAHLDR